MKKKLHIAISVLLLLVITSSSIGVYPAFKLLQYRARREVKQQIKKGVPESELHRIVVTGNEDKMSWVKPNKEFVLNGNMYDVVRRETEEGKLVFYCINDEQEEQLFTYLDEMVSQQLVNPKSKTSGPAKTLIKIMSQDYLLTDNIKIALSESDIKKEQTVDLSYNNLLCEVGTPPPELV